MSAGSIFFFLIPQAIVWLHKYDLLPLSRMINQSRDKSVQYPQIIAFYAKIKCRLFDNSSRFSIHPNQSVTSPGNVSKSAEITVFFKVQWLLESLPSAEVKNNFFKFVFCWLTRESMISTRTSRTFVKYLDQRVWWSRTPMEVRWKFSAVRIRRRMTSELTLSGAMWN